MGVSTGDMGMGTLALCLALGIVARVWFAKWMHLPYTVIVLLMGMMLGCIVVAEIKLFNVDNISPSAHAWTNLPPAAIMYTLIPILLFESAFAADVHIFLKQLIPVMVLAVPVVIVTAAVIGLVLHYAFPYNWDFWTAFMFGGMIAPTDPVAVVSILKELGVAETLAVLVEGESLLNDGSGIVIFVVFSYPLFYGKALTMAETAEKAATLVIGGPLVGVFCGAVASTIVSYIPNDSAAEITMTVVTCIGSFVLAEYLHVSGVLALVCAGLYLSFYGKGTFSHRITESMHAFWHIAGYIANTLIFFISGLIVVEKAFLSNYIQPRDWALLLVLYLVLTVTRAVSVLASLPILSRGIYGISLKQSSVLIWGGLKGAVSLALALAIHKDDHIPEQIRELILFHVAGLVILTIVINGSTTKPLVAWLGLNETTTAERELFSLACLRIEGEMEGAVKAMQMDKYFGDADWTLVWRYLPVPIAEVYWKRLQDGCVNLLADEVELLGEVCENNRENKKTSMGFLCFRRHQLKALPRRLRGRWRRYATGFGSLEGCVDKAHMASVQEEVLTAARNHLIHEEHDHDARSVASLASAPSGHESRLGRHGASHNNLKGYGQSLTLPSIMTEGQTMISGAAAAHFVEDELELKYTSRLTLREARSRLLAVLKRLYWEAHQKGLLSSQGIRVLERNATLLSADTSKPINEWAALTKSVLPYLGQLRQVDAWRKKPIIGPLVSRFMFSRLSLLFELSTVFIEARSSIQLEDLFGSGPITRAVAKEIAAEVQEAASALNEFLPVFPETFNSIKTEIASRHLLNHFRNLVEHYFEAGKLNQREYDAIIVETDRSLVKLFDHPHSEPELPRAEMLYSAPFLNFLAPDEIDRIFTSEVTEDSYMRSGQTVVQKDTPVDGWFLVVRGSVVNEDDGTVLQNGSVIGLRESLLGLRAPHNYKAATFVHLLFFRRTAVLEAAEKCPNISAWTRQALLRSLYWLVAAQELHDSDELEGAAMGPIGSMLGESPELFRSIPETPNGITCGGKDASVIYSQADKFLVLIRGTAKPTRKGQAQLPTQRPLLVPALEGAYVLQPGAVAFVLPTWRVQAVVAARREQVHLHAHPSEVELGFEDEVDEEGGAEGKWDAAEDGVEMQGAAAVAVDA